MDPYQDPACHFDADPDPSFIIKAQNIEKVLRLKFHTFLVCHQQIDANPDPDLSDHFDADPDPDPAFQFDAEPDLQNFPH